MTADDWTELGRRAAACKHFRPMPGMRDMQARTWTPDLLWRWNPTFDRPDFRDPATLGCLLALARGVEEASRGSVRWIEPEGCAFFNHPLDSDYLYEGKLYASEAEALVAVLEARHKAALRQERRAARAKAAP
jgi:hypothetical protein